MNGFKLTQFRALYFLIIIFLLLVISQTANAAFCARELNDGTVGLTSTSVEQCTGMIILTKPDFEALIGGASASSGNLEVTLNKLFAFDAELFAIVELALIMAFLTSHFGGRIVRWFGKS
ncbi:hypothetical protein ACM9HF_20085 [Colwellia sp. RE-S-Sl-9]